MSHERVGGERVGGALTIPSALAHRSSRPLQMQARKALSKSYNSRSATELNSAEDFLAQKLL